MCRSSLALCRGPADPQQHGLIDRWRSGPKTRGVFEHRLDMSQASLLLGSQAGGGREFARQRRGGGGAPGDGSLQVHRGGQFAEAPSAPAVFVALGPVYRGNLAVDLNWEALENGWI